MNLLVFEKYSFKISKNLNFVKIIGLGLNFTYESEVCSKRLSCSKEKGGGEGEGGGPKSVSPCFYYKGGLKRSELWLHEELWGCWMNSKKKLLLPIKPYHVKCCIS